MNFTKKGAALAPVIVAGLMTAACTTNYQVGASDEAVEEASGITLEAVVAARSDEDKARDEWRNPAETLSFFGVQPDDTVVEALPGRGWYTRVILPYVAENGRYAGANYQDGMWPLILPNPTEELIERLSNWTETFPAQAGEWAETSEPVTAFEFGAAPQDMLGQVDAVLMIRALHNFNRAGGNYRDEAIADVYALLKPGGTLGIVQHRAADDAVGPQGDGSFGYLRTADVIAMMEEAGFVFEEASEINANPADQPGEGELVWRLPPTYGLGDANRDAYAAIGESDRMTLRFRKPAE